MRDGVKSKAWICYLSGLIFTYLFFQTAKLRKDSRQREGGWVTRGRWARGSHSPPRRTSPQPLRERGLLPIQGRHLQATESRRVRHRSQRAPLCGGGGGEGGAGQSVASRGRPHGGWLCAVPRPMRLSLPRLFASESTVVFTMCIFPTTIKTPAEQGM